MLGKIKQIAQNGEWHTNDGAIMYKTAIQFEDGTQGTAFSREVDLGLKVGDEIEYTTRQTKRGITIVLQRNGGEYSADRTPKGKDALIARQTALKAAALFLSQRKGEDKDLFELCDKMTDYILNGKDHETKPNQSHTPAPAATYGNNDEEEGLPF